MSYFKTKDKKDCCACSACIHSCPVHAIKFERDEEGFDYPIINNEICINCGLCEKVCPVAHPIYDNEQYPKTYALYLRDVKERQRSSSGGVFYAIALWVLERGGVVFGSIIDEQNQVYHIGVDNLQDLQQLRGSKYVQSALKNVFKEIKLNLQAGRWCYFVGTGCQVAGLNAYLRKKYDTLITSDLVCHGVPSQWMFDQHIYYLEKKYKGRVSDYRFRDNRIGGGSEIFSLTTKKGKKRTIINPTYLLSPYLYSFMYAMTCRYSCYDCKFAKVPRQGDITLADYWGSKDFFPDMDNSKGISLCLLNTEMGKRIWEFLKDEFDYSESNVNDAAKNNLNLISTSTPHSNRSFIYEKVREEGYKKVAKEAFRVKNFNRVWINAYINQSLFLSAFLKVLSNIKHKLLD
ncbi:Coenzyme F420 hydrogenase/dehydrogenase, beta subunit C-terminal domain [Prevotella communis]|nr:Coenzyme F420 hydrogenase/dehydrogenase, beta subunit C-terminal domain [Prevotella communis]